MHLLCYRTVDILVNNAGMEAMDAVPTTDGIERVYQVTTFLHLSLPKFRSSEISFALLYLHGGVGSPGSA